MLKLEHFRWRDNQYLDDVPVLFRNELMQISGHFFIYVQEYSEIRIYITKEIINQRLTRKINQQTIFNTLLL